MKHVNVALFVPDEGCPHQCSFCNQKTISGSVKKLTTEDIISAVKTALSSGKDTSEGEIAFFGGSFTGIEHGYMVSLLECAYNFVQQGFFKGIRISTRPDYINDEILILLKKYGVTAIELGCQSMDDRVLKMNNRGHTSNDVVNACNLIKKHGFELGVQMMTGLYGDTPETCIETAKKLIALYPATVRIYPTIVLKNTQLAELYKSGIYKPQTLEEAVYICSELIPLFENAGIKIIRLGLHSGGNVEEGYIAGAYHPAFAEICKSRIYLNILKNKLNNVKPGNVVIQINPKYISQLVGQNKSNILEMKKLGYNIKIKSNSNLKVYELIAEQ